MISWIPSLVTWGSQLDFLQIPAKRGCLGRWSSKRTNVPPGTSCWGSSWSCRLRPSGNWLNQKRWITFVQGCYYKGSSKSLFWEWDHEFLLWDLLQHGHHGTGQKDWGSIFRSFTRSSIWKRNICEIISAGNGKTFRLEERRHSKAAESHVPSVEKTFPHLWPAWDPFLCNQWL